MTIEQQIQKEKTQRRRMRTWRRNEAAGKHVPMEPRVAPSDFATARPRQTRLLQRVEGR